MGEVSDAKLAPVVLLVLVVARPAVAVPLTSDRGTVRVGVGVVLPQLQCLRFRRVLCLFPQTTQAKHAPSVYSDMEIVLFCVLLYFL